MSRAYLHTHVILSERSESKDLNQVSRCPSDAPSSYISMCAMYCQHIAGCKDKIISPKDAQAHPCRHTLFPRCLVFACSSQGPHASWQSKECLTFCRGVPLPSHPVYTTCRGLGSYDEIKESNVRSQIDSTGAFFKVKSSSNPVEDA